MSKKLVTPLAPIVFKNQAKAQAPRPGTSIGMAPTRPDRMVAQPALGVPKAPSVDRGTEMYTYFTRVPADGQTPILYNGDRAWAKITLVLETAGPVVVGQRAELGPVVSGKGRLLVTNEPYEVTVAKGTRIYILATAVNRVSVTIEPLPWLEQIALAADRIKP